MDERECTPPTCDRTLVRDVMQSPPITIDPEAPIGTALATMRERTIRHLPVVDDAGALVGIVTDRDLRDAILGPAFAGHLEPGARRRVERLSRRIEDVRVSHVMTWAPVTIAPEAPIAQAAALMFERRVGSLPVVERAGLVGLVTERDVLKALAATLPAVRGFDPDTFLP